MAKITGKITQELACPPSGSLLESGPGISFACRELQTEKLSMLEVMSTAVQRLLLGIQSTENEEQNSKKKVLCIVAYTA